MGLPQFHPSSTRGSNWHRPTQTACRNPHLALY
ncbi:MAG: hypothetical protein [Siphoviridae sp. ct7UA22]|nr:MAG: hypothetical protein [Siphoviridae sp. ct7UA22]